MAFDLVAFADLIGLLHYGTYEQCDLVFYNCGIRHLCIYTAMPGVGQHTCNIQLDQKDYLLDLADPLVLPELCSLHV